MESTDSAWTPPQYDLSRVPHLAHTTQLDADPEFPHNFARQAKWCPDGSVALAQCENRSLQFLNLPPELLQSTFALAADGELLPATPRKTFVQPSPLLDFAWYPSASPRDPASFCFVASVRDCPVKLLDANNGRLRASYKIVDHRERQIAPHSMAFNMTAEKLYCGFEDAIEVFDVHCPGEGTRLYTTPNKKSRDGLKGIISALAFAPDASSGVYAAGSLSPSAPSSSNIALFSEATGEAPVMFVGAEQHMDGAGFGIRASVSQLKFNPIQPYILYGSFRRHDTIYSWDLRGDVSNPIELFVGRSSTEGNAERGANSSTNQRFKFDIDTGGRVLSVGDQNGNISFFDLTSYGAQGTHAAVRDEDVPAAQTNAGLTFKAHGDAVGSVAFHPWRPMVLSVSGSRHFDEAPRHPTNDSSSSSSDSEDEVEDEVSEAGPARTQKTGATVTLSRIRPQPRTVDSSAKLWSFQSSSDT